MLAFGNATKQSILDKTTPLLYNMRSYRFKIVMYVYLFSQSEHKKNYEILKITFSRIILYHLFDYGALISAIYFFAI